MNVERMSQLADAIEKATLPVELDMSLFSSEEDLCVGDPIPCGAACCIAGWACLLFAAEGTNVDRDAGQSAERLLGLTYDQAQMLFFNDRLYIADANLEEITVPQAVAAIRRLIQEQGRA